VTGALAGCRVVVCRGADQASALLAALSAAGAEPVPLPLLEVAAPADGGAALAAAVDRLERYQWVFLTSANGARALAEALAGRPWPGGVRVATVGPATTAAARAAGLPVDLPRPGGTGADLARAAPPPAGTGVALLPVAEAAGPDLADGLRAAGWEVERVDAYRTVVPPVDPETVARARAADAVVLTSPSTVERFLAVTAPGPVPPLTVCIGPTTAARAAGRGLRVAAVARQPTPAGLVAALAGVWNRR
jgi:uroporphyrinogen-III synthase